jgi:hypothetical protein
MFIFIITLQLRQTADGSHVLVDEAGNEHQLMYEDEVQYAAATTTSGEEYVDGMDGQTGAGTGENVVVIT